MHRDVKMSGAQIRTHDLSIRKRVRSPLHHITPSLWTQPCAKLRQNDVPAIIGLIVYTVSEHEPHIMFLATLSYSVILD